MRVFVLKKKKKAKMYVNTQTDALKFTDAALERFTVRVGYRSWSLFLLPLYLLNVFP